MKQKKYTALELVHETYPFAVLVGRDDLALRIWASKIAVQKDLLLTQLAFEPVGI